jgi:predicted DCC family thiol-disulfide oxidoreductase YuxK
MRAEAPVSRPILVYDGECGFCRHWVDRMRRWDRRHVLAVIPFQDQARVAALGLPLPALAAAMHLVLPDGRVFAGADAVAELLRLLEGKRWLAWPFRLPGVLPLARRVYAAIARRRHCLVRGIPAR